MGPKKSTRERKKTRRTISIEQKKEIIDKYDGGARVRDLASAYGTSHSTISTILAKKEAFKKAEVAKGCSRLNMRAPLLEEMENLLLPWVKEKEMAGDTTPQEAICQKAKQIYQDLKRKTPGSSSQEDDDFKASRGWFDNFKKRTGIHNATRHDDATSADKAAVDNFVKKFEEIVKEGGYLPQQIFSCAETDLFWNKMLKKILITEEEKALPVKDRLTLLLAANASGDCKVKPLLVYHSENPRDFKKFHLSKSMVGVLLKSNSRARVTRGKFREWYRELFGPVVKSYLQENNLPLKAILALDNAPGHPADLQEELEGEFGFLKVVFFPPNTTSLIQPMNQLVIANFKKLYIKALFKRCFEVCTATSMTLTRFWKEEFNISTAISLIEKAWGEVSLQCLKAAWRKACPFFAIEDIPDEGPQVLEDIVMTAHDLNLELEQEDVEELLEEHQDLTTDVQKDLFQQSEEKETDLSSLSEDAEKEQITSTEIKTILAKWEEVQNAAMKWNPNKADVSRTADLFNEKSMQFFRNILKKQHKQSVVDKLFSAPAGKKPRKEPEDGNTSEEPRRLVWFGPIFFS